MKNANGFTVGAFNGPLLVGSVALQFHDQARLMYKAKLIGMFVRRPYRGTGMGRQLVEFALDTAREKSELTVVVPTVTHGNKPAVDLYHAVGFKTFGVEPRAINTGIEYLAKEHMWLQL